jgi:xanthine dehydrogenase accessory factor
MKHLGYDVFVFDTRENVSTVGENKHAQTVQIVDDYQDVAALIQYPELTQVVVMTTDVASDVRGLLGVIHQSFPFIGVMGSQAKITEITKRLKSEGITKDQLSRLTTPVGIPMASNTPEEIAISVAAQILQKRDQVSN